jgi:hypothetical protein
MASSIFEDKQLNGFWMGYDLSLIEKIRIL